MGYGYCPRSIPSTRLLPDKRRLARQQNGSINLADRIDSEGAAMMLMMTWGRRDGDAINPTLYPNYTVMQDRLEEGYIDYRDTSHFLLQPRFTSHRLDLRLSTSMIPLQHQVVTRCHQHRPFTVSTTQMVAIPQLQVRTSQRACCLQH